MNTDKETCEQCRCFESNNPDGDEGNCRRFPPQVYLYEDELGPNVSQAFPRVNRFFDWCGEFAQSVFVSGNQPSVGQDG